LLLRAPGAPNDPQDPFTLILFSYFLPFSKKQTTPTFAFTALSGPLSFWDLSWRPWGPFRGPPWLLHNCDPCDYVPAHPPPDRETFKSKALEFHNFYVETFPFAIVKPAMHSIIDHFWEYVGDLGAMAAEALESQHKDFRFALSQLAYHGDIQ
jgi:hypothetical protein